MQQLSGVVTHHAVAQVVHVDLATLERNVAVVGAVFELVLDHVIPGVPLPDDFRRSIFEIGLELDDLPHPDCAPNRIDAIPAKGREFFPRERVIRNDEDVAVRHRAHVVMKDVLAGDVDIEPPDDVAVPIDELHRTVGRRGTLPGPANRVWRPFSAISHFRAGKRQLLRAGGKVRQATRGRSRRSRRLARFCALGRFR